MEHKPSHEMAGSLPAVLFFKTETYREWKRTCPLCYQRRDECTRENHRDG